MKNLTLKLPRPRTVTRDRIATNLYLRKVVRAKAREIAELRYGWCLSELVDRLLAAECDLKLGLLHREFEKKTKAKKK